MALNIVSNQSASIANRALQMADRDMTASLRKLSSGSRVESARDDAAAMAIGSRLKGELAALKTVSTNAQQGIAVFQIAEGGMSRVYDILVRLKSLASQAGSSQLSATERGMLDTEYQAMLDEIDRLAANTTFNGNALINAAYTDAITGNTNSGFWTTTNVLEFQIGGMNTNVSTLAVSSSGGNYIFVASQANGGAGNKTMQATLNGSLVSSGALISGSAIRFVSTDGSGNVQSGDNAYIMMSLASGTSIATSATATATIATTGTSTTSFAFKVGTSGISTNDEISLAVRGVNSTALGIVNSNVTTQARADSAAAAVTEAINLLVAARSEVGAVQNRLDAAQTNIGTILENIEAARSAYLDLDIAAEMSNFTSKQILVQAGVSMLAQANKTPQDLLRLFQN